MNLVNNSSRYSANQGNLIFEGIKQNPLHHMEPELSKALAYFNTVEMHDPQFLDTQLSKIDILTWRDQLDEALKLAELLIEFKGYDTDIILKRVLINIQSGELDFALRDIKGLQSIDPYNSLYYRLKAMCLFQQGQISEGWKYATTSFNFENLNVRYQNLQRWNGESLDDKVIVLTMLDIRGGGDEIMFASIIPEIIRRTRICFVETEKRALSLFEQSFKNAIVFCRGEEPWKNKNIKVDFHCWSRELAPYIFPSATDFPKSNKYLELTDKNFSFWDQKLQKVNDGKFTIGLCWRSYHSVGPNMPMCTKLNDWEPVFKMPNVTFINLLGIDDQNEVLETEKKFGIRIHSIDGSNFSQNFDNIAGIAKACDAVITVPSTTSIIAKGVGANVLHLQAEYTALCMDILPWFPNQKLYTRKWSETWESTITHISKDIRKIVLEHDKIL